MQNHRPTREEVSEIIVWWEKTVPSVTVSKLKGAGINIDLQNKLCVPNFFFNFTHKIPIDFK